MVFSADEAANHRVFRSQSYPGSLRLILRRREPTPSPESSRPRSPTPRGQEQRTAEASRGADRSRCSLEPLAKLRTDRVAGGRPLVLICSAIRPWSESGVSTNLKIGLCKNLGTDASLTVSQVQPKNPADEHDDAALAAAAAKGDLDAFADLVRRHQGFVFGAVNRVVKDVTWSEDITQEVFIRAYRGIRDFRGESAVRSWLYRIATNLALNAVTRQREQAIGNLPDTPTLLGPAQLVEASAMAEAMQKAIAELPPEWQEPLLLRQREDCSYEEIAERLGIPLNTVRTRIFRARQALQTQLKEWR